ncbi:MAG TPA: hypothetical protein VF070_09085 [Streptosporangiaceae bacterium]
MSAPGAGRLIPGRLYLGWQYAEPHPPPGPPPRRPTPPEQERVVPGWVAAQRREENLLNRPVKAACGVCVIIGAVMVLVGLAGWLNPLAASLAAGCAALVTAVTGNAIWQGERAFRQRVATERRRVDSLRAESESRLFEWQAEHADRVRDWQARRVAYEHQKRWYGVAVPDGIHRVDVAGGTLSGWSAMLTTAAAHRLAEGGEVTVLDLTESAVALDLIAFADSAGIASVGKPLVWVLPEDLPQLDLGRGLDSAALADVLSLTVSVSEEHGSTRDLSFDNAILGRVLDVLRGSAVTIGSVTAALRALGQVGNPADDVAAGLITDEQADRLRAMFGRGAADRVVIERSWVLEAQLSKLTRLGTAPPPMRRGNLRVVALSRHSGVLDARVLAAFLAVTLTHGLRGERPARPGLPWQHTLFVLGADRLRGDLLDRLCDACESTGTGLVLAYRTITGEVKERLGRGDAAVAFMRLGNAEDAKAASDQIGTEQRFVLSQFTETAGRSVTDTTTGSYTSTAGWTGSLTTSRSSGESVSAATGHGRGGEGGVLPLARTSHSRNVQTSQAWTAGDAESVSAGISQATAWGQTTSAADGSSESVARTVQRSREFLVEQHELQQLPASAMIVSYAGPRGRELLLADANPGIGALPSTTMCGLGEILAVPAAPVAVPQDLNEPNLGPPPARLDWRRPRALPNTGGGMLSELVFTQSD